MSTIIAHPRTPTPPRPALVLLPRRMDDLIARLEGSVLYVDPSASTEDQLDAIADAVQLLRTGRACRGGPIRHLRGVS